MNETDTSRYSRVVAKLLTYGSVKDLPMDQPNWPNYLELGIEPEHIPELIRLIADKSLRDVDIDDSEPRVWAAVHAWRALSQLKDISAVEPLLNLYEELLNSDTGYGEWAIEELPEIFARIGPVAIPQLADYLTDTSHNEDARINVLSALQKIGEEHPDTKEEVVSILTQQLERFAEENESINAYVILALSKLGAKDALSLIEHAFAAEKVDEFLIDLDYVLVEFGLKERKEPMFTLDGFPGAFKQVEQRSFPTSSPTLFGVSSSKQKASTKAKNKMAKASRKKNRRKK